MWFDNLAIPKDARNVAEAHAFIDYMLRPEVAAKNSQFPRLRQRQSREPEADRQGGARRPHRLSGRGDDGELYIITARDQRTQRLMNRLWTRIKTGTLSRHVAHRQRRCSQSHCSGCSRTQPSTTSVIACMVPCDVDLAVGVARRRRSPRSARRGSGRPGSRIDADAVDRAIEVAREPRDQRIGLGAAGRRTSRRRRARNTDRPACRHGAPRCERVGELHRRVEAGRHQRAHAAGAHLDAPHRRRRRCSGRR